METANLLLILLAVFVALFLAVFQYIFRKKERGQLNYWLSFFRFLSLFSIFILLINPTVQKEIIEIVKPNLVVAVDNSSSIKHNSQGEVLKTLVERITTDKDLNAKFNIDYYSFGKNVKPLDSLAFNENHTNLFESLNSFSKIYKKGGNPVVFLTDGNQTVGNSIAFSNYESPIYAFIVGDTTAVEDLYINQLNVNKNTFINNKFPVEVFVNYDGNKSVTKKLSVYYKGRRLFSKQLSFSKTDNVKTESFFLSAENKGIQYYVVKIESLENEENTINNSKNFSVNVIEEKSEILLLTSIIHPDLGMLKKAIESNKQRSVSILNINNYKGIISDYQLIILYQPNQKFKVVFQDIQKEKLNYFIISGLSTDWNFLNIAQNNFSKKAISVSENYNPIFNPNYTSFMGLDIGFSSFAPLEDRFGAVRFSIPYQPLLFQKIGNIETEDPLLATFENNNQRGAVLFGENLWRWRMNSFSENKTFELFDGFVSNLMQYLSSNFKTQRLNVSIKPLYYSNETIEVSANYLDENLNSDTRVQIWLTVSNKETNYLNKIPFALVNNQFIVELSNIPAGEYDYSVGVTNEKESISGNFKILAFEVEQQFTQSNNKDLKKLASKTNGEIYYANQETNLVESLKKDERYKSVQKSSIIKTPLIDWKWILGFIIFLLSVEWFTRKYFGKI
ncbi:MAG: VWA domain-containing protein [Bacteroidetes bacterium]|nr:VWA domain-containing protein [Bacteroidota bacterium]